MAMRREEELKTQAGQYAIVAARLVSHMEHPPGIWDFLEVFKQLEEHLELEARKGKLDDRPL
jgi:hypothetical protein